MLTSQIMDRKWKPHLENAPNCPRCSSSNTKFCYYNNYSLSQPRYFCKACRRYWTKGGSLRNVPVGGGCRKSRRARSALTDHRSHYSPNSTAGDSSQESGCNNGSDIDLAVVFANFLNQEPKFQPDNSEEFVNVSGTANSLTSDSDTTAMDFQPPLSTDDMIVQDSDLVDEFPFPGDQELNEFGLQSLLGDELVQDALWSEATTSNLSNNEVTWQPEEFDSLIAADDQLNIPTNFMIDNVWSSFDLPGF